jgi:LPXTG-site transpeptidase (sortase) family protein
MSDAAIVVGVGEAQLQQGPGHYPGTALPGQAGNVGIAGHRTTYGAPFYDLDQLQSGDPIYLQVPAGIFQYAVTKSMVVSPSDIAVLSPEPLPMLTLTTCNPRYSSSTRLVVVALMEGSHNLPGATVASATPTTTSPPPTRLAAGATPSLAAAGVDGAPTQGGVVAAAWWGAVLALAWLVVRFLARRPRPRPVRLGALVLGAPGLALVLFAFFEHVSVTLPASF